MSAKPAKKQTPSCRAQREAWLFLAWSGLFVFFVIAFFVPSLFAKGVKRPHITRIASVTILVSDLPSARLEYQRLLKPDRECNWCEQLPTPSFSLQTGQILHLNAAPSPLPTNLLGAVELATDDLNKMKSYLQSQKLAFKQEPQKGELHQLLLTDPDGHPIAIKERGSSPADAAQDKESIPSIGATAPFRLIHAGFIVRNRAAMEHFYKDILGFRPYWHGGMKDDQTDWEALQVPDGTDWVEFMLNVPQNADQRLRGIMNHIALGVTDIHETAKQLQKNGVQLTEEPKIGRDGKWQLNVYDPDQTRIEFMELTPKEKPCCSEFTGPHPKP